LLSSLPTTTSIQKRARKSIAPIRPPIVPPPSTNSSIDKTVCHLCGYLGRTKSISIDKNGYNFLRHLPPAPGALSVNNNTHYIRACHLCVLLLDKQRELNRTSTNFFFKGFFRSIGSCHNNIEISNSTDKQEQAPKNTPTSSSSPQTVTTEVDQSRSMPPPLRKTSPSTTTNLISDELSSLDSIHSRFLSDYTSLISSSKTNPYDSCQLCLSIKPHGTLYSISKSQFEFLSSSQN